MSTGNREILLSVIDSMIKTRLKQEGYKNIVEFIKDDTRKCKLHKNRDLMAFLDEIMILKQQLQVFKNIDN